MGNEQNLEYGDVIRVNRGIYYHYGIYADNRTVYQYAARGENEINGNATVHITTLEKFAKGGTVQKLNFSNLLMSRKVTVLENESNELKFRSASEYLAYVKQRCKALAIDPVEFFRIVKAIRSDYKLYTPKQTIARAESRLGEASYNLALNNCESYAMWCKTGVNISYQTLSVLFLMGPLFPELALSRYAMTAYSLLTINFAALPSVVANRVATDIAYLKDLFPSKDNE